jgi:hypothetical protein
MFQNNQVEIINQSCIESNNSKIKLFHLRNGERYLWLIYFCNYNELLLELFLKFSIKIKFIYSVCDGILAGMGGNNQEIRIPTKFYSFFYKALNTKFHISQFHNHLIWDIKADEHLINTIQNIIQNINQQFHFNTELIDKVENNYQNPVDVYKRFHNFGNTSELWLREC